MFQKQAYSNKNETLNSSLFLVILHYTENQLHIKIIMFHFL